MFHIISRKERNKKIKERKVFGYNINFLKIIYIKTITTCYGKNITTDNRRLQYSYEHKSYLLAPH
jgi:uncharacterized membrane protein YvbJ